MRISEEDFDKVIEVNLKSVFNLTKAVLRPMLKQRSGSIINMSSVVGVKGNAGMGRQSILAVGIQTTALSELIVKLKSEHIDLSKEKLPNPFQELPQLSLNGVTSVMQALLAQSALLTQGESMIMHFFNQDIEKAYLAACSLGNTTPTLAQYQTLIKQKYLEAVEFDDLLNNLLN